MRERIPYKGGFEHDVFSSWRHVFAYASRAGVCKKAKKQHNRRKRRFLKSRLDSTQD
jgi:hypothetical protein